MPALDQILEDHQAPFELFLSLFEKARSNKGRQLHQLDILIAGDHVRINTVGNALAVNIGHAFAHLKTAQNGTPSLIIDVWDAQETGIRPEYAARLGDAERPDIVMKATRDGRYVGEERRQGACWLDRNKHRIVAYTGSAGVQYLDERARPFHKLLSVWLSDRGIQFIHSGLIAHDGKGVLFVGNGGAGKSTSSIACLQNGFHYLGDDFVGFRRNSDNTFTGYGFFASCLLNVDHLLRFPDLKGHALTAYQSHEEKSVIFLQDIFRGCLRSSTRICALALPRIVDSEKTGFRPATKAQALFAIAPTSVMFLPSPNSRALDRLAELVEKVPAYWLELGRDIQKIPGCIEQMTAEVAA